MRIVLDIGSNAETGATEIIFDIVPGDNRVTCAERSCAPQNEKMFYASRPIGGQELGDLARAILGALGQRP